MPFHITDNITSWCYGILEGHYDSSELAERVLFRKKLSETLLNNLFKEYATQYIEDILNNMIQGDGRNFLIDATIHSINWDTLIEYLDEHVLYDEEEEEEEEDTS